MFRLCSTHIFRLTRLWLIWQSRWLNSDSTQHFTCLDWLNSDSTQITNFLTWLNSDSNKSDSRLITFYLIWAKVVDRRGGGVQPHVVVGWFFPCQTTDKCNILTILFRKIGAALCSGKRVRLSIFLRMFAKRIFVSININVYKYKRDHCSDSRYNWTMKIYSDPIANSWHGVSTCLCLFLHLRGGWVVFVCRPTTVQARPISKRSSPVAVDRQGACCLPPPHRSLRVVLATSAGRQCWSLRARVGWCADSLPVSGLNAFGRARTGPGGIEGRPAIEDGDFVAKGGLDYCRRYVRFSLPVGV